MKGSKEQTSTAATIAVCLIPYIVIYAVKTSGMFGEEDIGRLSIYTKGS